MVAGRRGVVLESILIARDYLVAEERENGLKRIRVVPLKDGDAQYTIEFGEPLYEVDASFSDDFEAHTLTYTYGSDSHH